MPLTLHQKNILESASHNIYGVILADAIEVWKKRNVIPSAHGFGIKLSILNRFIFNENFITKGKYKCCLIGAALVGKTGSKVLGYDYPNHLTVNFSISIDEAINLYNGFDNYSNEKLNLKTKSDAFLFGRKIGKILFIKKRDENDVEEI